MRYFLARLDEKHKVFGNFETIFKKFLQKFVKMLYFTIYFKRFNKPMRSFFAVWTKNTNCWEILRIFDETSIEKLNLIRIFGKFVTKNRAFGDNTIFLQQFFRLRGGGIFPPFPPLNPPVNHKYKYKSLLI